MDTLELESDTIKLEHVAKEMMMNTIIHIKEQNQNILEVLQQKDKEEKQKDNKMRFDKSVDKTIKAQFPNDDELLMARVKD